MKLKEFLEKRLPECSFDGDDDGLRITCPDGNLRNVEFRGIISAFVCEARLMYEQGEFHPEGGMTLADQTRREYTLKLTPQNCHSIFIEFRRV